MRSLERPSWYGWIASAYSRIAAINSGGRASARRIAGSNCAGSSMSINCGPGRRFLNVTTGLRVSRNSLSADEVSEHIMSASPNSSRMLSLSAKRRYSFSSARNFAVVSGFIFGWKVTTQRHSPLRDRRFTSSYSVSAALHEGEKVEWYRMVGGAPTGRSSPPNSPALMKGSTFGQPVSTTLKWPTLSAMAWNCAVSRGPVVQYRSKKPRM